VSKIRMGKLSDISPGSALEKRILARRIAIFNDNGKLYGIESDCKHMRASLVGGSVRDGILTCKWHGWQYDLSTGSCLNVKGVKLKQFEVTVDGDDVFLHYDRKVPQ